MTTGYQYDGDPKITITESGADIEFRGGQPVMDRGLENAAIISLFTEEGWAGNRFLTGRGEAIGSRFEEQTKDVAITVTAFEEKAQAAREALSWMIETGLAGRIETEWQNPSRDTYILVPIIFAPGGGKAESLMLTKNGPNWINQKKDPASARSFVTQPAPVIPTPAPLLYYGVTTETGSWSQSDVEDFGASMNSYGLERTWPSITAGVGEYLAFALPASIGLVTFWVSGFEGGFEDPETVAIDGVDYNVWRSVNSNLGSTVVTTEMA